MTRTRDRENSLPAPSGGRGGRSLVPALLVLLLSAAEAWAQPKKHEDPLGWDQGIRKIMEQHCFGCHGRTKLRGDVDLMKDENPRLIAQNPKLWRTVLEVLESGQMPPKKEKQPDPEQRKRMIAFLKLTLDSLDCAKAREPGPPSIRRLNRTEYDRSILALTGLDLRLAEDFSPDPTGYGFDTIAEALAFSPALVEQYHQAARKAVEAVAADPAAKRRIFLDDPEAALRAFATGAFRRPVEADFVERLTAVYRKTRGRGESHETALKPLLAAVLVSPRFLVRLETIRPDAKDPYPVDGYDLASRLSFFLWSGPPDEALLEAAATGGLASPEAVEAQARRMLADPRSRALVENFFGQWLQLRGLPSHKPDPKVFPGFTEALKSAMAEEVVRLMEDVVRNDRPITDLLDADYAWLNEALAAHYGIEGVKGTEFRRVALPDRRRGGVLTSGALLMLQADPDRNNVPRRGNFLAGTILGQPPPPPPPDVPPLEESKDKGRVQTLRELLEEHRRNPECASCHAKIDPLGFGLENFDAIGRWRDAEAGKPVDASGELPGGVRFNGPVELKKILVSRKSEFARTLTENLLIYALGRGLRFEDECVVRDALKASAEQGDRFSALVATLVRSYPFRHRRSPEF